MKRSLFIAIVVLLIATLFVSCNADKATEDQLFEVTVDSGARTLEASGVLDVDVENLVWFYEATKTSGGFKYGQTTEKTAVKANDAPGLSGASLGSFSKGTWQYKFYGYAAADVTSGVIAEGAKPVFQQLNCVATIAADYTLSVTLERGEGALPAAIVKFATLNWFHDDFKNEDHTLTLKIFVEGETTPRIDNIEGTWVSADGKATFNTTASLTLAEASTLSFRVYEGTDIIGTENIQIAATPGMTYTVAVSGTASGITPVDTRFGVEIDVAGTAATLPITTETAVSVKSSAAPDSTQAEAATTVSFPAGSFTAAQAAAGDKTLTISIMNVEEANNAGFTISNGQAAIGAISLDIDGVDTSNFNGKTVTIETYIAAGLDPNEIDVVYTGTTGDQPDNVEYDPSNGKLVFTTTHFSEYVIVSTAAVAFNANTKAVYTSIQDAIDDAQAGETVKLLKDQTITTVGGTDNTGKTFAVLIDRDLTLDGNNHLITANIASLRAVVGIIGSANHLIEVNLDNLMVETGTKTGLAVETRGDVKTITVSNCTFSAKNGTTYRQALTIGGYNSDDATITTVNVLNSTIKTDDNAGSHYAFIIWNPVKLSVTDSTIKGYANLYFKEGSAGSTATIIGGSMTSVGIDGASNSFGMITFEDGNIDVALEDVDISVSTTATISEQALVVFSEWFGPNTGNNVSVKGGSLSLSGDNAIYVIESGTENTLKVTDVSGVTDYSYTSPELNAWYSNGAFNTTKTGGMYITLDIPFNNGWMDNGEGIILINDVVLDADINCSVSSGTIYLYFDGHTVTGGKVILPAGVSVVSDTADMATVFEAPSGSSIVETTDGGLTTYSVQ